MQRTNRIIVTDTGWIHEQDNKKIVRKNNAGDKFLAEEKGYNTYVRTDDSRCKQAAMWWQQHKLFWNIVRQSWDEIMKNKKTIHLASKVEEKLLDKQLDLLENRTLTQMPSKEKIKSVLTGYVDNANGQTSTAKTNQIGF